MPPTSLVKVRRTRVEAGQLQHIYRRSKLLIVSTYNITRFMYIALCCINRFQPSYSGYDTSYGRLLLALIRADCIQPYLYLDEYVHIRTWTIIYMGLVAVLDSAIKLLDHYWAANAGISCDCVFLPASHPLSSQLHSCTSSSPVILLHFIHLYCMIISINWIFLPYIPMTGL